MGVKFVEEPKTYETEVVDPGAVATGGAVGTGVGAGIGAGLGALFALPTGGLSVAWGAALGGSIGAGLGGPAGTAIGTGVGTTTEEFPVGAGPQGYAAPGGGGGLNLDSFAWEEVFKEMDEGDEDPVNLAAQDYMGQMLGPELKYTPPYPVAQTPQTLPA